MLEGSPKDPLGITGKVIEGKYLVESCIGEGGAGVVYRARNKAWDMPVAIKLYVALSTAPEESRDQLLAEFIQEGRLMSMLSSRSAAVVQPRDMGAYTKEDGTWLPFLVLEWLEGAPLDMVIVDETQRGVPPRTLEETMRLLEPAVQALDIAHGDKIVHRDIKPENMFVLGEPRGPDARVKLLDFGIAKVMQEKHGGFLHTAASATPFTPHYGAPEQFSRGYGATGPWTDVFALALVVLEVMRGGNRVFSGDEYMELSAQSRDEEHRPTPRRVGLVVSDDVEAVFSRAVALMPQDRYASAGQFWSALRGAVFPEEGAWAQPLQGQFALPSSGPTPVASSSREATPKKRGGARMIILGASALGLLIIVSAAVVGATGALKAKPVETASPLPSASAAPSSSMPPNGASGSPVATAPGSAYCPPSSALIPGGHFDMGDGSLERSRPEHRVFVDAFCLDRTEVTAADYARCVDSGECKRPPLEIVEMQAPPGASSAPRSDARLKECTLGAVGLELHPMNCIAYDEAAAYCTAKHMRLPSEAEWEYAAAGTDGRKYPWGTESLVGRVNACGAECVAFEKARDLPLTPQAYDADDKFPGTAPVKSFPSGDTKNGIADLSGNVSEWVSDYYAPYTETEEVNPKGPATGEQRIVRGGSFECADERLLAAERSPAKPDLRSPTVGFRCASMLLSK